MHPLHKNFAELHTSTTPPLQSCVFTKQLPQPTMAPTRMTPNMLPSKIGNKVKRQQVRLRQKKAQESAKRIEQFRRKKEESKNPELRAERLARSKQQTLDNKRVWDEAIGEDGENMLGLSVDMVALSKRQKLESETAQATAEENNVNAEEGGQKGAAEGDAEPTSTAAEAEQDSAEDSMLEESDLEEDDDDDNTTFKKPRPPPPRETSPISTTSTTLAITPESLASKFPTLFVQPPPEPKILVTTSINSTLHKEADLLTELFPNSVYVPRTKHHHAHKFSVREISKFAANRNYTTLVILKEDQKRPTGLDVVHLPDGPTFHFSMTNWVEGKKLPGHGNATGHVPELVLNNFKTPLGLLTAHLFRTMFPPRPQVVGRQVVTLHNQRDFIFLRRHRYIFRDKRPTEKSVQGDDGRLVRGVEDVRAGLQELGPRFTLKLRRVDRGVQRASGQEWEWKTKTDKVRTKFQM